MIKNNINVKKIKVKHGKRTVVFYEHQEITIQELNFANRKENFSYIISYPPGGGKTDILAFWLSTQAINKHFKLIWICHRDFLIEQASVAFEKYAYSDIITNRESFNIRLISSRFDNPENINMSDDILIVSKDSLINKLNIIEKWANNEQIYLVIDEAHHAVAKTYKKIIDSLMKFSSKIKILGITATPIRSIEKENKLLGKIFTDGILYNVNLQNLIKKKILATPIFETCKTNIFFNENIDINAIKLMQSFDVLPEKIAFEIVNNSKRNRIIINKYLENHKKYGQTIVFAMNRTHAKVLKDLFDKHGKDYGIKADFIISGDYFTDIVNSSEENAKRIEAFKNGDINVLINVNILTEGADLPATQTVFLTRPTMSKILMIQMIGRGLRGIKAGGTSFVNIVNFVDGWKNAINWVNPETLIADGEFNRFDYEYKKSQFKLINSKILKEFAKRVDDNINTTVLEEIEFIQTIPIGMYNLKINKIEMNYQILVFSDTKISYENLIANLPNIAIKYNITENIDEVVLNEIYNECSRYFNDNMITFIKNDVFNLIKFYAIEKTAPSFYKIEDADREILNLEKYAKEIIDKDMCYKDRKQYINNLWVNEIINIYFENKEFFVSKLNTEINKIIQPDLYIKESIPTGISLNKIEELYPKYYKQIKEEVYARAVDKEGKYCCAICKKKSLRQDLFKIVSLLSEGAAVTENLILICENHK
ncbi:DEAD/DEAH box helicase [Sedimentibacter sp. B4]|uniref:DEAD/DEAH box helicase n=1 Tax=Sedimentibacter sp. B4 TaxID=304766 RepID=UPI000311798B|nr:DEAD/DEAH box helicase [Sedimentibacter sp. B4]